MYYIYDLFEVTHLSELTINDCFIIINDGDVLCKNNDGYELNLINYNARTVYRRKECNSMDIVSVNGNELKHIEDDILVQRVKILQV